MCVGGGVCVGVCVCVCFISCDRENTVVDESFRWQPFWKIRNKNKKPLIFIFSQFHVIYLYLGPVVNFCIHSLWITDTNLSKSIFNFFETEFAKTTLQGEKQYGISHNRGGHLFPFLHKKLDLKWKTWLRGRTFFYINILHGNTNSRVKIYSINVMFFKIFTTFH